MNTRTDAGDQKIEFGVYGCELCHKSYTVNVAHTFDRCTPTRCHECNRAYNAALKRAAELVRNANPPDESTAWTGNSGWAHAQIECARMIEREIKGE